MSAIAGVVSNTYSHSTTLTMLETMKYRGREAQDFSNMNECVLMHAGRAGIKQPITLETSEEIYSIVFNGAIYNKKTLKAELQAEGFVPTENNDANIVLQSYVCWGENCLDRLNGVFSFAVWHSKQKLLFLARDRIGVKPLFYTTAKDTFIFASEIKTILKHPLAEPILDEDGIAQILLLGPGRVPGSGVLRNILELEPGMCGVYTAGTFRKKRYWKLTDKEHRENLEDTAAYVRWLINDSINLQTKVDLPLGCLLSGGLDSSIISTICAQKFAEEGRHLQTFSLDFQNNDKYFTPGKYQPESDSAYISLMVSHIGSEHKQITLTADQLIDSQNTAILARDLPGMADIDTSLLLFCGEIHKDVDIIVSGECADEIFGGYPWYRDPEICAAEGFPWSQNVNQRAQLLHPQLASKIKPKEFVMDHYRKTIESCDILPGTPRKERRIKEMMQLNLWWFMQTLLDRKDRMSMYNGLEPRVPFCDYRIVEYLYGVPWEYKDCGNREKGLLRYAMNDILPTAVSHRKKSPYPKTYDPKYLELITGKFNILMDDPNAPIFQIVNPDALKGLLKTDSPWPWYGQLMRLPQTIAYMLQLNTWMMQYHITIK